MDYHSILGTTKSSTLKEIKRKFRSAALKKHSDHGGSDDEMKILNEAYYTLSDPDRRFLYENEAINNKSYLVWSRLLQPENKVTLLQIFKNCNVKQLTSTYYKYDFLKDIEDENFDKILRKIFVADTEQDPVFVRESTTIYLVIYLLSFKKCFISTCKYLLLGTGLITFSVGFLIFRKFF